MFGTASATEYTGENMNKVSIMGSCVNTEFSTLQSLMQYEMLSSERYRRFMSVVMVSSTQDRPGLGGLIGDHVRNSDVMSEHGHSVVVLMGETDKRGAMTAVQRYHRNLSNHPDLRFSIATYPEDGVNPDTLMDVATQRLTLAKASPIPTIM